MKSATHITRYIAHLIGVPAAELDADLPLGEQAELSSLQVVELAIALEQECGVELPDDIDLRRASLAELDSYG